MIYCPECRFLLDFITLAIVSIRLKSPFSQGDAQMR